MNYKDLNDFEIVYYVRENNDDAHEMLFTKYKPLIEKNARKLFKYCRFSGLELNDLIQEGLLGLNQAIHTFDESKETTFYTYAKTCIERKQISAVIMSQRQKHRLLNESISYEIYNEENELVNIDNLLIDNSYNPENIVFDTENTSNLFNKIKGTLTELEVQVFELKVTGFSYLEIAEILDKDKKAIDNAIQRIKLKINNIVNK